MKQITYDYTNMLAETIGEHGVTQSELHNLAPQIIEIARKFENHQPSFAKLPSDSKTLTQVKSLADQISSQFENLIVLGIGGSDLGARSILAAINSPYHNFVPNRRGMRVFFLGGNTDPQEIADVLQVVNLKKTAINIISKSGDTIEPMSAFVFLRQKLIDEVGVGQHAKHIIATTDAEKGTMREITDQNGYASLVVPNDVGGRFSVLSTVGLFPAACAGIDIGKLLAGAAAMDQYLTNNVILTHSTGSGQTPEESRPDTLQTDYLDTPRDPSIPQDDTQLDIAQIYAALHFLGYQKGQHIHVVMPYAEHLRQFGFWYRQLWAESLGKKESLDGRVVNVGPTPVASLGATDQHSQMQLYNEGPFDKLLTFIRVESFPTNYEIPKALEELEGVQYMAGHDFAKIINTEAQASAIALAQNGRPNGTLILPKLDESTLGELFMLYEWACAYMGELLKINTYNQPGVEAGKKAIYALLGREDFEGKEGLGLTEKTETYTI